MYRRQLFSRVISAIAPALIMGANVPQAWRDAAPAGRAAIRNVRSRKDYEAWYPTFAGSGLAVATWPVEYLGLDLTPEQSRVVEAILEPFLGPRPGHNESGNEEPHPGRRCSGFGRHCGLRGRA